MLPYHCASNIRELAHLGGIKDYKLLTCRIGDLWRFVTVDKYYKEISEVGPYFATEKELLTEAYDYAVNTWNRKPLDPLFLVHKRTPTTEEIGAVKYAISVLDKSSEFDEIECFYLRELLKKLTQTA